MRQALCERRTYELWSTLELLSRGAARIFLVQLVLCCITDRALIYVEGISQPDR